MTTLDEFRSTLQERFGSLSAGLVGALETATDRPDPARPLERASVILSLNLDPDTVYASLLAPDGSEDRSPDAPPEVMSLCEGVDRISAVQWDALDRESAESLRRMFVAMAADVRVVLIVLADRLVTLRRGGEATPERERLARQTLDIFAPLANRLGVGHLKWELEDLAFAALDPATYADLQSELAEGRDAREAFLAEVVARVEGALEEHRMGERIIRIRSRPKHLYSIHKKMRRKSVPIDEIYDASALRIIVEDVRDCYAVLGIVHGLWMPIAGEFDDYIARPKRNMYQSLHTAVLGPGGRAVEIQIRTLEMHEFAEYGVAAHWAYKEGRARASDAAVDRKFDLLRQLMEWQRELSDPATLAEALRTDLFEDQVHVFTPAGEVVVLPKGATPLDFAYRIHTSVGHRCRGAKINEHMVSLQTELRTGDRVEILTRKEPTPSRDWLNPHLNYLVTSGARQKVRQWFRQQGREAALAQGREILERELVRLGLTQAPNLESIADRWAAKSPEELLVSIGFGDIGAHKVAEAIAESLRAAEPEPEIEPTEFVEEEHEAARSRVTGLAIGGFGDVLGRPARCCRPVPGDDVVGYISRGRGVMVHRRDCSNIVHAQEPERLVDVDWGADRKRSYPAVIELEVADRPGVLRDVTSVVGNLGLNLRSANSSGPRPDGTQRVTLSIEIRTSTELVRALARLEALPVVLSARRRQQ